MKLSIQTEGSCPTRRPRFVSEEAIHQLLEEAIARSATIGVTTPVPQEIVHCEVCDGYHMIRIGIIDRRGKYGPDFREDLEEDLVDPDDEYSEE